MQLATVCSVEAHLGYKKMSCNSVTYPPPPPRFFGAGIRIAP